MLNVGNNVHSNHTKCKRTICLEVGQCLETDFHKAPTATQLRVMIIMVNLCSKADSFVTNSITNNAKVFMRQVAKFNSGERTFHGRRNSFNIRSQGAGMEHQFGPHRMMKAYENKFERSPPVILKILMRKREKHNTHCRSSATSSNNPYYGPACRKPDISDGEIKGLSQDQVEIMNCTIDDQKRIEVTTRGQSDNPKWYEERKYRLTTSRSGEICMRRLNLGKLVESVLYKIPPN
ncbi:hypothetical protein JTB14_006766 [Gonioctena quinquepunctata]|nr:hypothetical protein JTB14_006766 [Gonioctena quinquepunctata]